MYKVINDAGKEPTRLPPALGIPRYFKITSFNGDSSYVMPDGFSYVLLYGSGLSDWGHFDKRVLKALRWYKCWHHSIDGGGHGDSHTLSYCSNTYHFDGENEGECFIFRNRTFTIHEEFTEEEYLTRCKEFEYAKERELLAEELCKN